MIDLKQGYVPNEVYKVEQFGNSFKLIDHTRCESWYYGESTTNRKNVFKQKNLRFILPKMVKKIYKKVDMDVYNVDLVIPMNTQDGGVQFEDKGDPKSLKILSTKVRLD